MHVFYWWIQWTANAVQGKKTKAKKAKIAKIMPQYGIVHRQPSAAWLFRSPLLIIAR